MVPKAFGTHLVKCLFSLSSQSGEQHQLRSTMNLYSYTSGGSLMLAAQRPSLRLVIGVAVLFQSLKVPATKTDCAAGASQIRSVAVLLSLFPDRFIVVPPRPICLNYISIETHLSTLQNQSLTPATNAVERLSLPSFSIKLLVAPKLSFQVTPMYGAKRRVIS